jgi:flagellar L-ring protein precursor FlgH
MRRSLAWTFLLLSTGTLAGIAHAQSNSLLNNGRHRTAPPPTTQPAAGAPQAPLLGPPARSALEFDDTPPLNEVLLTAALIAVEAPRPRRIQVHDLVTIIIREEKQAVSDTDLKSDKKWEIDAELKKWIRINEACKLVPQAFPEGTPALGLEYEDKYKGKGKVRRKDSLITRITATVIDVKPNGDLVLQAKKDITVDEDRQMVTLTGICRSLDVTAQNTVLSTQLADARINIQHAGPARDAARRGWLARIWDLIRPF